MKKQTFEILPLQGVYWKDKDLKLTFGMSVSEFDALIPDATQTTKYQGLSKRRGTFEVKKNRYCQNRVTF